VHQHGADKSGGLITRLAAQRKAPKGETNRVSAPGSSKALAMLKCFQNAGDVKNAPLARESKAT
jgi:hypothetical protein